MKSETVYHGLKPVYDQNSKILILGTMPSPKSRELGFYYSHPQNRLWRILSELLDEAVPESGEAKTKFLHDHHIAMWDVLSSCSIQGADDNSIKNPKPNDIKLILSRSDIKATYTTGKKASDLYQKLCFPTTGIPSVYLPSTSPANCRSYTYQSLVNAYSVILENL